MQQPCLCLSLCCCCIFPTSSLLLLLRFVFFSFFSLVLLLSSFESYWCCCCWCCCWSCIPLSWRRCLCRRRCSRRQLQAVSRLGGDQLPLSERRAYNYNSLWLCTPFHSVPLRSTQLWFTVILYAYLLFISGQKTIGIGVKKTLMVNRWRSLIGIDTTLSTAVFVSVCVRVVVVFSLLFTTPTRVAHSHPATRWLKQLIVFLCVCVWLSFVSIQLLMLMLNAWAFGQEADGATDQSIAKFVKKKTKIIDEES